MRHLLASSAVAGLLVLLPVGDANAQDNRNTWDWGAAGGVVLSFIAGGASLLLLQRALKGKRDDEAVEPTLAKLNSSVEAVDTKLENLLNNVNGLTSTLESEMNLENAMGTVSANVRKTLEQHITKVEGIVETAMKEKGEDQIEESPLVSDKEIGNCNNQLRPLIIDTSAIINCTIINLLKADLFKDLEGRIIIHECVKNELNRLRKDKNTNKRKKGEIGYNNLMDLCLEFASRIERNSTHYDLEGPDDKLLQLTSDTNGRLVTRDGTLAKRCCSKNLKYLNLDDLYQAVQRKALVGREVEVCLQEQSENDSKKHPNDAVAWIDDRRIVVKNANDHIGQSETTIIITHASERGTYFAEILTDQEPPTIEAEQPPKPDQAP